MVNDFPPSPPTPRSTPARKPLHVIDLIVFDVIVATVWTTILIHNFATLITTKQLSSPTITITIIIIASLIITINILRASKNIKTLKTRLAALDASEPFNPPSS